MRDAAGATRRVVPRSRAPKSPPKRHPLLVLGTPLVRLIRTHPGKSAAAAVVGTLMIGIVGNAVMFQHGRHPAPLFGSPPPMARPDKDPAVPVPLPQPRPADAAAAPDKGAATPADGPAADPTPVRPAAAPARPASAAKRKPDGISALLRGDPPPSAGPASKSPDPAVLQAQHALAKLGYDVKPDGLMGAATRQALDKFAAERHLPAMAATLDPRLLHVLLQAAGKPQE